MSDVDMGAVPVQGDAVLLSLIAQRSDPALAMLYDTRAGLVYSLALSIVHQPEDAEEVTADVFVRVWQKAHTFRPTRGEPLAWLLTLTRRLAIDRTRSKMFKAARRESELDAAAIEGNVALDGDDAESAVRSREILQALEQLDEPYREVIRLSYLEGLSHSMIAERLDTPLGTVKSRVREGVIRLRRILGVEEI